MSGIWADSKISERSITFFPKSGTTWKQMNQWFETEYGSDKHWKWQGFGEMGKDACAVLVRQACVCCNEDSEDSEEDN